MLFELKIVLTFNLVVNHPCVNNNSGCSHLCFVNQGQAMCSCPKYKILGENKRTCECKELLFFPINVLRFAHLPAPLYVMTLPKVASKAETESDGFSDNFSETKQKL